MNAASSGSVARATHFEELSIYDDLYRTVRELINSKLFKDVRVMLVLEKEEESYVWGPYEFLAFDFGVEDGGRILRVSPNPNAPREERQSPYGGPVLVQRSNLAGFFLISPTSALWATPIVEK